jgi:hypothetical protein
MKVKSPYLYKIDLLYRVNLRRCRAQLMFSVKPAELSTKLKCNTRDITITSKQIYTA